MVGIVILNYNNWQDTINCVESVERYNTFPIKYVIVDNCSSNGSFSELDNYFSSHFSDYLKIKEGVCFATAKLPYLSLISTRKNYGYAGGNNVALKLTELDNDITHILILNNDIIFIEDIIGGLVDNMSENTGIISPLLYKRDGYSLDRNCARKNVSVWETIRKFTLLCVGVKNHGRNAHLIPISQDSNIEIELPSGSCMLISKALFQQIDYFDPNTFLYWEEGILHKKIQRIGKKNYLTPKYHCIHLGASATSSVSGKFLVKTDIESCLYYYKEYDNCKLVPWLILKFVTVIYFFIFNTAKYFKIQSRSRRGDL